MVQTPDGVKFTKNGSFSLDASGNLVTKDGDRVLSSSYFTDKKGTIQIPNNARVTGDSNGNIYADGNLVARLFIAQPNDLRNMQKIGDNLYKIDNLKDIKDIDGSNGIAYGYVQMSNVNPVTEMVGLIETNRLVDMYQKVMTTQMNDLNQDAIQKLASIKA